MLYDVLIFYMILLNNTIILDLGTLMHKICSRIHDVAFVMSDGLTRNTVVLEIANFLLGVGFGIAICSAFAQ